VQSSSSSESRSESVFLEEEDLDGVVGDSLADGTLHSQRQRKQLSKKAMKPTWGVVVRFWGPQYERRQRFAHSAKAACVPVPICKENSFTQNNASYGETCHAGGGRRNL